MPARRAAFATGGMSDPGETISRRLHDVGMPVAVTRPVRSTPADAWLDTGRAVGRRFETGERDVRDFDSRERAARRAPDPLGQVDVLVNNAGITCGRTFVKMTKADWDAVVRTLFNITKPFVPGMIERGFGRVANSGSVNGSHGAFGQTSYAVAKAGLHGFTTSLALEVATKGVTVNTVSPGYLATAMGQAVPPDVLGTRILPQIPVGRLGQPVEVAALNAFLCPDEAGFVTGADIAINGGMHMQ